MMMTRCPSCRTGFRVTPEQLKARGGRVRCGHCNGIFNALESLQDAPLPASAAPPASAAVPAPAPNPSEQAARPPVVAHHPLPEFPPPVEKPAASPVIEPAPAAAQEDALEPGFTEILIESVDPGEPARPASRMKVLAWGLATLLALGLLAAQAAYLFRTELALWQPALRLPLEKLCALLECKVPLPRKADLVSIEASDLHPDPQQKKWLVLAATLKNRAPFAQDYPSLELTLTDAQDQPVLRKVFAPGDFLGAQADPQAGFAAEGELTVNLWLDPGDVQANGYRLYLFYP